MHIHRDITAAVVTALAPLAVFSAAAAQGQDLVRGIPVNPQREAYYGDLHLHTSYSFDAYLAFGAQIDPDRAYRFARGEAGKFLGEEVKRSTPPLDFLAVTDHAELIGVLDTLEDPNSALSRSEIGKGLKERNPDAFRKLGTWPSSVKPLPGVDTKAIAQTAWQRTIEAANRHYRPGKFTTFIAYEWTAHPSGLHLHRNVIFRGDKAPPPFTSIDSIRPEDLWRFLESIRKQGYEALAIPHNSNLSKGLAFAWVDSEDKPIDQVYAARRAANEPLVEISQNKGQSETRPSLSPNDELAHFELLDYRVRGATAKDGSGGSYVRDALGRGLKIAVRTGGANPFKYGFVGGSDFHNGLSESAEDAYGGLQVAVDSTKKPPDVDQWLARLGWGPLQRAQMTSLADQTGSGNLTGVWAEQNTRESLYAALRRKETFATSGTRLKFRFFGGWGFTDTLLEDKEWVKKAYRIGVPMGGDLPPEPTAKGAPKFAIWAVKDPDGANLDRLQVVKMWLEGGNHIEKIYDVALSNGRKVDPKTGKSLPVGNTVDVQKATYTNTIGAVELLVVWQDPQFDPKVPAVYYLRVLEIPTPRWSTIDAVKRGQALPERVPATLQERGWSSPIWYTPLQSSLPAGRVP